MDVVGAGDGGRESDLGFLRQRASGVLHLRRMHSQPQVGPRVIAQSRRGDLDVDVDDAFPKQDAEAAGHAPWCGARRRGEGDETGPAVCGERVENPLVFGGEVHGVVGADRGLRERGAVVSEHGFLLRGQRAVECGPVVAAASHELAQHGEGTDVEHRGGARKPLAEELFPLRLVP